MEPKYLYQKLMEEIRAIMHDCGEGLLPSERELAGRFGVNRRTVRQALEELERIGEVVRHAGRGYMVNALLPLGADREKPRKVIGYPMWLHHYEDLDFNHAHGRLMSLRTIRGLLKDYGYELDVQFVGTYDEPNYPLITRLLKNWGGYITEPLPLGMEDPFLPLRDRRVLIGYEEGAVYNCVRQDFMLTSRLSLRHLAERGAKRILCVGQPEGVYVQSLLREIGLEQEANRFNGVKLIRPEGMSFNGLTEGYSYVSHYLSEGGEFDAVLCYSAWLAVGAVRALIDYGLKVPDDVQVIGSGGLSLYQYFTPRITTVKTSSGEINRAVANMMHHLFVTGKPQHSLVIPVTVQQGETTRVVVEEDYNQINLPKGERIEGKMAKKLPELRV